MTDMNARAGFPPDDYISQLEAELAEARAQNKLLRKMVVEQGYHKSMRERAEAQIAAKDEDCQVFMTSNAALTNEVLGLRDEVLELRELIEAIEATDRRLIEENGRLQAQIAAKDAALRFVGFTDEEIAALAAPAWED